MYRNYVFRDINQALPMLLGDLIHHGDEVSSRNGRVKELTHVGITLNEPWRRELSVPYRKPNIAAQIAETMWVLAGRNDVEFLGNYLPRAKDFSDDGETWRGGYGPRLREWAGAQTKVENGQIKHGVFRTDQLRQVVELLRADPLSRRAVMSIFDPAQDFTESKDIPCNNWLSFSSRLGKLDLHVAIRSNDAMWGWSGINAFEWSALQEIVAGLLGIGVGSLHFSVTSFHLYQQHWAKAEQIIPNGNPDPRRLSPRFDGKAVGRRLELFDETVKAWFNIEELLREGHDVSDMVELFPEPMLQSWLRVLQWWWTGSRDWLADLEGTALEVATFFSVQPPKRNNLGEPNEVQREATRQATELIRKGESEKVRQALRRCSAERVSDLEDFQKFLDELQDLLPSEFIKFATQTHNEKHAAYGDSWKRRGEMLGIMANIARKIDRLGKGETSDETSADTAMDLMVYLAKYHTWLQEYVVGGKAGLSDTTDAANALLTEVDKIFTPLKDREATEEYLRRTFDRLEDAVNQKDDELRIELVEEMLHESYRLARYLWEQDREREQNRKAELDRMLQQMGPWEEDRGVDDYRGADID